MTTEREREEDHLTVASMLIVFAASSLLQLAFCGDFGLFLLKIMFAILIHILMSIGAKIKLDRDQ